MLAPLAALALAAAPAPLPAGFVDAVERLPLPRAAGPVTARTATFEASVLVESPRGGAELARALSSLSRLLCPVVEPRPRGALLRCRSPRVVAEVVSQGGAPALELRELSGLPWSGDAAMPLVFHEPAALGLGSCGASPAARGECLLRDGRTDDALAELRRADAQGGAGAAHARLRLGDLALAGGDPAAAARAWGQIALEPWARLAEVRRCELTAACVAAKGAGLYAADGLPVSVARELRLRAARTRALRGEPLAAAWSIAGDFEGTGACAGGVPLCRRIVLSALRDPAGRPEEALALHAAAVRSDQGAHALELAEAAAALAEGAGAPGFAAALLSSSAGHVSDAALPAHLLRTAELYAAAGDAVRAGVLLDFARARLGAPALRDPRWQAVAKAAARRPRRKAAAAASAAITPPSPPLPELTRARAALARAQALPGGEP